MQIRLYTSAPAEDTHRRYTRNKTLQWTEYTAYIPIVLHYLYFSILAMYFTISRYKYV